MEWKFSASFHRNSDSTPNQSNTGRLPQNSVASTVWSPWICSKHSVIGRQIRNRNGVAVKCGVWVKQNIVVYLSGYGDLQSDISLLYKHQLKRKTFEFSHALWLVWSMYSLGLLIAPPHYGITWPVWIPTVLQTPVTLPLHSPKGRQMPAVRVVQGDC